MFKVEVKNAVTKTDAAKAARAVADYDLVKCAVHGGDANWGRIVAAAGKSPARVAAEKLCVKIGGITVFARGRGRKFSARAVERHLAGDTVAVAVGLGLGRGRFTAYTCDLSREYVAINADYHT